MNTALSTQQWYAPFAPEHAKVMLVLQKLAGIPRDGWVRRGVTKPEDDRQHTLGMIDFVDQHADELGDLNLERVRQLCFVHEWPESICGDTNIALMAPELRAAAIANKHVLEMAAMESICGLIGGSVGDFALAAYVEFEGNVTPEARFTKQLDKFHAVLKAWEYQSSGQTVRTMDFIEYGGEGITHPVLTTELARIKAEIAAQSVG